MKKQFKIIETEDYILAVSDEEITGFENNIWVFKNGRFWLWNNMMVLKSNYKPNKVIACQPKGDAPELDLPLLPEITVEDDVEKLAESYLNKNYECYWGDKELKTFIEGYEAATKVYNEEDMRKAIELSRVTYQDKSFGKTMFKYKPGEVIQLTKDSKTPEWFVAEIEQVILKDPNSCEHYIEVGCIKDICTCYTFKLKTTTINNKAYLVGCYE
jgi:hypothetical protein